MIDGIRRPTWDEQHMMAALLPAVRTSCLVRAVGAALVRDNRVIASAYNGAPPEVTTCHELGYCVYQDHAWKHIHHHGGEFPEVKELYKPFCIASHAEVNVMSQCSMMGVSPVGCTLYVTTFPCFGCSRDEIVGKGIAEVKVWKPYLSDDGMVTDDLRAAEDILKQKGIPVSYVDLSPGRINEMTTMIQLVGTRTAYKSESRDYTTS